MSSIAMPSLRREPDPGRGADPAELSRMTLGVLNLDPSPWGAAPALAGIQRAARESGYALSIASLRSSARGSLLMAVERLCRVEVQGVLVIAPEEDAIDTLAEVSEEVPLVAVEAGSQDLLSAVAADHYAGAAAATQHLLALGHRTIFHLAGPAQRHQAELRLAGWRDTLTAAGRELPAPLVGDWSAEAGYHLGRTLAANDEVTAIFAASDQMALGVLRALAQAGRSVPGEVSVVGFDGICEGEFLDPPLTTVAQDYVEVARSGFRLLRDELELGRHAKIHELIPAQLLLRSSTARLA